MLSRHLACSWMVILFVATPFAVGAEPVISEFLASSSGASLLDDDGEPSDWIEIHNPDSEAVNLAGYGLTDSPDEVKWTFPEVTLEAGGYLLVFASGKDRGEPGAPLHANFQLDRSGEYLALTDPQGEVLTAFDPEYPGQERDVSYGMGVGEGGHAVLATPTPGAPNEHLPPVIEGTDHFPKPADPGERLTITAIVRETAAPVKEVRLLSRVMFRNEAGTLMRDDGEAPDAMAGDGIYTAQISNRTLFGEVFHPGHLVRWAVEAEDDAGRKTRYPPHAAEDREQYTGTILSQDPIDTQLEVFHWFVEEPRRAEMDQGTRSVCYYRGELYDNCFTRLRGGTARSWPKKSFKVEFPEDHHFRFDPELPRVDEFNLNATYTDKSYSRAILTSELHQDSGTPAPVTFPLRVHQNGEFYSVALFVEQCDRDFLRRNGLDPDGSYYKANPGSYYTGVGSFEKKTRRDEGKEDASALVEGLRLQGAELERFLMDHVDLPAQINFLAGIAITQNIDNSDKNHFLYRDTEGSGEWFMTPWDLDLTFGPDALNTDRILANEERRGASNPNAVHPFIGSRKYPLHAGKTNELIDRLFITSRTRDMFLRRLRTLHDRYLATDYFDRRLDELLALFEKDTLEDRAKWGGQSHFPGRSDDMATTVARIKAEYLVDRRDFFERGGLVDIPQSMPEQPKMVIGQIDHSPVSGDQDEEYIQLTNPNGFAVDLSGWRLEGAVEHTFRPGTVIPAGSLFSPGRNVFYVVKDAAAFRSREEEPAGGAALFVQGDYRGRLSNWGEEIRLVDEGGTLIASATYEGAPTVWQRHLVISEFLAEPDADGEEWIELTNSGDAPLDLAGVRFTRGISFVFPEGSTLSPGEFVLVVRDRAAMEAIHGAGLPVAGEFGEGTRLDNAGETVKLEDPENNTVAEFRYGNGAPWPEVLPGHAHVFLGSVGREAGDGARWAAGSVRGGTPNGGESSTPEPGGRQILLEVFGTDRPEARLEFLHGEGEDLVQIAYPVLRAEGEGFLWALESSTDLKNWTPTGAQTLTTEPNWMRFRVARSEEETFFRVRLEREP